MENEAVATQDSVVQDQAVSADQTAVVEQVESQETAVTTEKPVETKVDNSQKPVTSAHVSKIVARETKQTADKVRREVTAQYEAQIAELKRGMQSNQVEQSQSFGGVQQQSQEDIRRLIQQEALNMSRQQQAQQIEQVWESAMKAEMQSDPDFVDLYDALNIEEQPHLVIAMAGMDNKVEMIRDLANNPAKYANILMLANSGSPKLAMMELNKLSQSIKVNQQARNQPRVAAPLSQVKPSNIAADNGEMGVSDYRKQPWLRG